MKNIFYLSFLVLALVSCQHAGTKQDDAIGNIDISDTSKVSKVTHEKTVKKIFYNIPSPTEMSSLLRREDVAYNQEFLHSYKGSDIYTTTAKISLNLGIYGADLSYNRLYNQTQQAVNYFSVIKRLSDALGIPQEQGGTAVERLESNIENKDSLLHIITDVYSNADRYLKENGRGSTAALIVTGGWVEAMYIAVQIASQTDNNKDLKKLIAEQKFSLNNLISLLSNYNDDESIAYYLPKIKVLDQSFSKIKITYSDREITIDEKNSLTTIGGASTIEFSDENFIEIANLINQLREEFIH